MELFGETINEEVINKNSVIIAFGPFSGLDIIHEIDKKLYDLIPEHIGSHDGHEVSMDDTDGRFFTYGKTLKFYLR